MTGFGIGEVKTKKIPILAILFLFLLGLSLINFNSMAGVTFLFLSIAGLIINISQPKMYGLKLYLNSGDGKIFITSDTVWLKKAVRGLYDFTENAQEGSYMTIQVGGSITGNIIQSSTLGDVSTTYE